MTEHRLSRRVDIAIPVGLGFPDGSVTIGLATNISVGGVFVKTYAYRVRHHSADLVMGVFTPLGEHALRMSTLVIHRNSWAIGLMFREVDEEALRVLSWLVATESRQPRCADQLPLGAGRLTR